MLEPHRHILSNMRIILASSSPRRKEILENLKLKFEIHAPNFEENLDKSSFASPCEYAKTTALHKLTSVAKHLYHNKNEKLPDLLIGADTVVTMDGKIYEKPETKTQAIEMLSLLNNQSHLVNTGVVLMILKSHSGDTDIVNFDDAYETMMFDATTEVEFDNLSSDIIKAYVETGEPMDKAGSYGIQGLGSSLIKCIHGDYFNVMGFPLNKFTKTLIQILERMKN